MSNWFLGDNQPVKQIGAATATSDAIEVFSNATANIKGAWKQIISATTYDIEGFYLNGVTDSPDNTFLIDIGIGAAAAETVLIPDVLQTTFEAAGVFVPVRIPTGTRLSVRVQSDSPTASTWVQLIPIKSNFRTNYALARAQASVNSTGATWGIVVDSSASNNTKGSWTQLCSSTNFQVSKLYVKFMSYIGYPTEATVYHLVDIGIGAAASESVLIPDVHILTRNYTQANHFPYLVFDVDLPAGTRISARCQADSAATNTNDRKVAVALLMFG